MFQLISLLLIAVFKFTLPVFKYYEKQVLNQFEKRKVSTDLQKDVTIVLTMKVVGCESYLTTKSNEVFSWIRTIIFAVIIAFIIRAFLFTNYIVDGESMLPTMNDGDRLVVNKLVYKLYEPERFDLIVFHANSQADYIKRVIGLPGDHIEYKNDVLYINGEPYEEPYLNDMKVNGERLTQDFTLQQIIGKETVPENSVFVLGDNRRNSTDSRHLGVIPYDDIVGEVNIKYWPLSDLNLYH